MRVAAKGYPGRFFPFHQYGYPTYSCTVVTTRAVAERDPSRLRAFLEASILGYRSYLATDPSPGNAIIRRENPLLDDDRIGRALQVMKATAICSGGDAATGGIGTMTARRWQATYAFMLRFGLLADRTDWRRAFSRDYLPRQPILI